MTLCVGESQQLHTHHFFSWPRANSARKFPSRVHVAELLFSPSVAGLGIQGWTGWELQMKALTCVILYGELCFSVVCALFVIYAYIMANKIYHFHHSALLRVTDFTNLELFLR